jgi:hypothetical protein
MSAGEVGVEEVGLERPQQIADLVRGGARVVQRPLVIDVGGADEHAFRVGNHEDGTPVVGRGQRDGAVEGKPLAGHDDVRAARRTTAPARETERLAHAIGPDAGGVDHEVRPNAQRPAGLEISHHHAVDAPVCSRNGLHHLGARQNRASVGEPRSGHRQRELGVVRHGIRVREAALHAVPAQRGRRGPELLGFEVSVAFLAQREAVVHQTRDPELHLLEISQAPVHELRRARRGAAADVAALDQQHPQTPLGCIEEDPAAVDSAADHDQVEPLVAA